MIGIVIGGIGFGNISITVGSATLAIGNFIQAIINFLLTALCVFVVVKVMNTFRKKKEEAPPKPSNEEVLLTEIRDLLKEQKK